VKIAIAIANEAESCAAGNARPTALIEEGDR
jgi:hypothetical protein